MNGNEELKRELMVTFQGELADHLAALNDGLLALETDPPQQERDALLADLFRAAHSIKGGAQVVELKDLELIAHRLEDAFGALQRGEIPPSPEVLDVAFAAADALQEVMDAHLEGRKLPGERTRGLLGRLENAAGGRPPAPKQEPAAQEMARPAAAPPTAETPPPVPHAPPRKAAAEETVRVATGKLDALMSGMGELVVAQMRFEQRLSELRDLHAGLVAWQKAWRRTRGSYRRLQPRPDDSPEMSALLASVGQSERALTDAGSAAEDLVRRLAKDCRQLGLLSEDLPDAVRRTRMQPIAGLFQPFPRVVRDLARERGKEMDLVVEGGETEVDRQVLEALKDPLTHMLRNAVDHGIEAPERREAAGKPRRGTIRLRAAQKGDAIVVEVADDGAGIDLDRVRRAAAEGGVIPAGRAGALDREQSLDLVFRSGLSTHAEVTDLSGRGVGLDVVRENLERLHGMIALETEPGRGTTFTLTLPLTIATSHVLLVEAAGQTVAVPTTTVERILRVSVDQVGSVAGRPAVRLGERPVLLAPLAQVLELGDGEPALAPGERMPVVVIGVAEKRSAFRVDGLLGTQEVIIKGLGRQLSRVRNVAGATILGSGKVVMILNPADLIKSAPGIRAAPAPVQVEQAAQPRVLVVDDSITTRTLEKNILENAGYEVVTAGDGEEAWALVQNASFNAVVADIKMPRMDGFVLTEKVKRDERYRELPLVLVTSLESRQDKTRGLEAGADAYITKGSFDQRELLATLERLIG